MKNYISLLTTTLILMTALANKAEAQFSIDQKTADALSWDFRNLMLTADGVNAEFQAGHIGMNTASKILQTLNYEAIESKSVQEKVKSEIALSFVHAKNIRILRIINNSIAMEISGASMALTRDEEEILLGPALGLLSPTDAQNAINEVITKLKLDIKPSYEVLTARGAIWDVDLGAWRFGPNFTYVNQPNQRDWTLDSAATQQMIGDVLAPRTISIQVGPVIYPPLQERPTFGGGLGLIMAPPAVMAQTSTCLNRAQYGQAPNGAVPMDAVPVRSPYNDRSIYPELNDLINALLAEQKKAAQYLVLETDSNLQSVISEWFRENIFGDLSQSANSQNYLHHLGEANQIEAALRTRIEVALQTGSLSQSDRQALTNFRTSLNEGTRDYYNQLTARLDAYDSQLFELEKASVKIAVAVAITGGAAFLGSAYMGSGLIVQGSAAARAYNAAQGANSMLLMGLGFSASASIVSAGVAKVRLGDSADFSVLLSQQLGNSTLHFGTWTNLCLAAGIGALPGTVGAVFMSLGTPTGATATVAAQIAANANYAEAVTHMVISAAFIPLAGTVSYFNISAAEGLRDFMDDLSVQIMQLQMQLDDPLNHLSPIDRQEIVDQIASLQSQIEAAKILWADQITQIGMNIGFFGLGAYNCRRMPVRRIVKPAPLPGLPRPTIHPTIDTTFTVIY